MQECRGERSRTICSCIHLDTRRNYNREFKLEFSWLQEQTLRLRSVRRSCNGRGRYSLKLEVNKRAGTLLTQGQCKQHQRPNDGQKPPWDFLRQLQYR